MIIDNSLVIQQRKVSNAKSAKGRLNSYADTTYEPEDSTFTPSQVETWDRIERRFGNDRRQQNLFTNKRLDSRAQKDRRSPAISVAI